MAASLDFVHKNAGKETNYREEQKELIEKALEVANGDKLGALQYIVSCLAHEGLNVEFEIEYRVIDDNIIIELPIIETEPKDPLGFYVSWGDGTITHNKTVYTYKEENKSVDYTIRFFGLGIKQFGKERIKTMLTKIISFGDLGHTFTSLEFACANCTHLKSVPANIPKTVTNLSSMFINCYSFNQSLNTWDTSNITDMSNMFSCCRKFNQPLEKWDTRNVVSMNGMFFKCENFNQSLNSWITSNVTNMRYMFAYCESFNQPLNSWITSNVTNMSYMFTYCKSFNQPLNSWITSNVTNMSYMFSCCDKFNQSLNSWDTRNVIDMSYTFNECKSFNQSLDKWDISKVKDIRAMFNLCLGGKGHNIPNLINLDFWF